MTTPHVPIRRLFRQFGEQTANVAEKQLDLAGDKEVRDRAREAILLAGDHAHD